MAKLGEAWVQIRANMKPLQAGLKKAFAIVKKAMAAMRKAIIAAAAAAVASTILITKAAITQEKAEFRLAAALKMAGDYSKKTMDGLKKYAAQLQKVTTYGDETTLMLMQLGKSLGVDTEKLKEATKISIGLASALGRDAASMMQYVSLAMQGEFTMLRRYIPALRKTTDAVKQMKIVQDTANKGFGVEMAYALKTASGALRQIKNTLGDVAEKLGAGFLGPIKRVRDSIVNWVENNQEKIDEWSKSIGKAVDKAIEHFDRWLDYLRCGETKKAFEEIGIKLGEAFGRAFMKGVNVSMKAIRPRIWKYFEKQYSWELAPLTLPREIEMKLRPMHTYEKYMGKDAADQLRQINEKFDRMLEDRNAVGGFR